MRRLCVVLILFLLLATVPPVSPQVPLEHTPRLPISIDGNEGLHPENGVTRGRGTPDDPYVIEGWLILGTPGLAAPIHLNNVTDHVVIQNNLLSAAFGYAIRIERSTHIEVRENHIEASNDGIFLFESQDLLIEANRIIGQQTPILIWGITGIQLTNSIDAIVRGNHIENHGSGIAVQLGSSEVTVENNTIVGGGVFGAIDLYDAHNVSVWHNHVERGQIMATGSEDSRIEHNTLVGTGIYLGHSGRQPAPSRIYVGENAITGADLGLDIDCADCEVTQNLVQDGTHYGGLAGWNGPLRVHNNTFLGGAEGWAWLGPNVTAHHNNFITPPDVVIESSSPTDFRHNWWDDPAGPQAGMLAETVGYDPWLTGPSPGAPVP